MQTSVEALLSRIRDCSEEGDRYENWKALNKIVLSDAVYNKSVSDRRFYLYPICGNPNCTNGYHQLGSHRLKSGDWSRTQELITSFAKRDWDLLLTNLATLLMTLADSKPSFLELPQEEQYELIRLHRNARRVQAAGNRASAKIRKGTGKRKATKQEVVTGQSLDASLDNLSLDELMQLAAKVGAKVGGK